MNNETIILLNKLLCLVLLRIGLPLPALPNHPGRATLISGVKKTSEPIPVSSNMEHIRSYSLSRTQSDQPMLTTQDLAAHRRTSASSIPEKTRRSSTFFFL